jgi:MFS transporter, UMF1 family
MAALIAAAPGSPRPAVEPRRIERRSVASWVVYDLANTAFSLGVVTLYFPGIVGDVFGLDKDATVAGFDAIAAAIILVAAPILGAVSDQAARRLPFLALFTLLCVTATFFMGQSVPTISFVLFVVAVVCYQAGLIFYDSLLPEVSTDENRGRIGGIGVGVGYIGSLVAIVIGTVIRGGGTGSLDQYVEVFRAIALAFLLFAIPTFLFVRERRRVVPPLSWRVAPRAFAEVVSTARHARRYPGLGSFLLGRMFYADAANTLIFMVIVFAETSLHMTKSQATPVAILTILFAIPAGLCWGFVVDRIGPRRTLDVVLVAWMGIFAVVAAIPVLGLPSELIYPVGAMVGIALAGLWASDRPLMARLAPPRYYGQFFGLYAMVGRFGAVVGPTVWALVAGKAFLNWGQPAAVVFLLIWVVIAFLLLRRVDDKPRAWAPEDLPELVADSGS